MQEIKTPSLIVTIKMQDEALVFFNTLRKKNYPAHFNYVDAHITLFHKLPSNIHGIQETLLQSAQRKPFILQIDSVKQINTSVLFTINAPELVTIHKQLKKQFYQYLTFKDRKYLRPHITIQNKVTVYKAQQTAALLQQNFIPFSTEAIGFSTYLFNKNKWLHQQDFLFAEM